MIVGLLRPNTGNLSTVFLLDLWVVYKTVLPVNPVQRAIQWLITH